MKDVCARRTHDHTESPGAFRPTHLHLFPFQLNRTVIGRTLGNKKGCCAGESHAGFERPSTSFFSSLHFEKNQNSERTVSYDENAFSNLHFQKYTSRLKSWIRLRASGLRLLKHFNHFIWSSTVSIFDTMISRSRLMAMSRYFRKSLWRQTWPKMSKYFSSSSNSIADRWMKYWVAFGRHLNNSWKESSWPKINLIL